MRTWFNYKLTDQYTKYWIVLVQFYKVVVDFLNVQFLTFNINKKTRLKIGNKKPIKLNW